MQGQHHQKARHRRRIAGLLHERKLTWDQVNEIRRRYVFQSGTHGLKALSEEYGVSTNNIHKIVRGKTWKAIEGDGNVHPPLADRKTPQQISKAFARLEGSFDSLLKELNRLRRA